MIPKSTENVERHPTRKCLDLETSFKSNDLVECFRCIHHCTSTWHPLVSNLSDDYLILNSQNFGILSTRKILFDERVYQRQIIQQTNSFFKILLDINFVSHINLRLNKERFLRQTNHLFKKLKEKYNWLNKESYTKKKV